MQQLTKPSLLVAKAVCLFKATNVPLITNSYNKETIYCLTITFKVLVLSSNPLSRQQF